MQKSGEIKQIYMMQVLHFIHMKLCFFLSLLILMFMTARRESRLIFLMIDLPLENIIFIDDKRSIVVFQTLVHLFLNFDIWENYCLLVFILLYEFLIDLDRRLFYESFSFCQRIYWVDLSVRMVVASLDRFFKKSLLALVCHFSKILVLVWVNLSATITIF